MNPFSRNRYNQLLCSAMRTDAFYRELSLLLENDPYFTPAILEHVWATQKRHDRLVERRILRTFSEKMRHVCMSATLQEKVSESWSEEELNATNELFNISLKRFDGILEKTKIITMKRVINTQIKPRTILAPKENRYLVRKTIIDPTPLQQELSSLDEHWWNIHVLRHTLNPNHQHTHAIVLRDMYTHHKEYTPISGPHESTKFREAVRFPHIYRTIMDFAQAHNLSLGRVAIVRLQPHQQSYRHYDDEDHLIGRNRYHLIVQSGKDNILSSGTDTIKAKPGDVWFFDNHVMHRADNRSSLERTHVIFDGYPLTS